MKAARALAAVALLLSSLASAASDPGVAAAQQKLDTARANLAKAVQRIEKDPPDTADIEAAHAAVGALKDVIDASAEHEQKDLEFAKTVLSARKELRTHREFVDQRRANIQIHNSRRTIDAALTRLADSGRRTEAKDASAKDFEEARTTAAELKKTVDEARQFAKQDPKFATYLTEVDATLVRHGKAVDDRWIAQSAEKHRSFVEEARLSLAAPMAALSKNATDTQFAEADRAISLLGKLLDEGKIIEPKDKTYRAAAEGARKELTQAKKKMDELWSETGLTRLKAEIEPAHKDLKTAGKAVRARKPTPDQLAEAKTAAIVVRKLLEKFQAEAARSKSLGGYIGEVNATLVEVEVELQKRTLDAAKADLNAAIKPLAGKAPTDENFQEAATAVTVLEKTLETVHTKDPALAQPVADLKQTIKDTKAMLVSRRLEVDVLRQRTRVEDARKKAADALRALSQPDGKEKLADAEAAVKDIRTALDEGAALIKKNREYGAYDKEVKERIKEFNDKIASRKILIAAGEGRTQLKELTATAKAKLEAAKQPESTDADVTAAVQSLEALGKAVDGGAALEKQDQGYYAQANKARDDFMRLAEGVELAKMARELRRQTTEALVAGAAAFENAANTRNLRMQKDNYEKAINQFKSCESSGKNMTRESPMLEKVALYVEGKKSTAKEVIALCGERAAASEKLLAEVKPLIAFDEGPKKSFEAGKGLLAASKGGDALKHFDECISSGMILQNRNPEMKERKFEVGGGNLSLSELIQQCISQRKALKGK